MFLRAMLIVGALLLAGCTMPSPGPMKVHLDDPVVTHLHHFNLTIQYQNTGDKPLNYIYSTVSIQIEHPNGTQRRHVGDGYTSSAIILNRPDIDNSGGWKGLFNRSDVIRPGESRNLTLHIFCTPRQCTVEEGDTYHVYFYVTYQDDTTRWGWRTSYCWDTSGTPVYSWPGCDRKPITFPTEEILTYP